MLNQLLTRPTSYTLGCMTFLMFLARYALFTLQESPKYLIAKGRDQDAIEVGIQKRGVTVLGLTSSLTGTAVCC